MLNSGEKIKVEYGYLTKAKGAVDDGGWSSEFSGGADILRVLLHVRTVAGARHANKTFGFMTYTDDLRKTR